MLRSEAVKARQVAEDARPFESQLQKVDARILAFQRQLAQAESRNAKAQEAAEKAGLQAKEAYAEYVESWMQLKQQYLAKGAVIASALTSAPKGVEGQDYAGLAQRAAELKAESQKQEELKDPKSQNFLAELMLRAVAIRRNIVRPS